MADDALRIRQRLADAVTEATKHTAEFDTYVAPAALKLVKSLVRHGIPHPSASSTSAVAPHGYAALSATDDRATVAAELALSRLQSRQAKTRLLSLHLIHELCHRSAAFRLFWLGSLPRLQSLATLCGCAPPAAGPSASAFAVGAIAAAESMSSAGSGSALSTSQSASAKDTGILGPAVLVVLLRTRFAAVAEDWVLAYKASAPTVANWVR